MNTIRRYTAYDLSSGFSRGWSYDDRIDSTAGSGHVFSHLLGGEVSCKDWLHPFSSHHNAESRSVLNAHD